jgi:hypothetical protein
VRWKKIKWHYFLLEYCYVVNYFTLLYFAVCFAKRHFPILAFLKIFDPLGYSLFRIAFAFANGPLALSVIAFRNGLIFHSLDHLTILAVHIGPACAMYGMRWYSAELEYDFPDTFHIDVQESSWTELFFIPCIYYVALWSVPYGLFMFWYRKDRIKERGYQTMYSVYESSLSGYLDFFGSNLRPVMYMAMHLSLSFLSFALAPFLWNSFFLNTAYILVLLVVSIWNGSTFYFEVFAVKYHAAQQAAAYDASTKRTKDD